MDGAGQGYAPPVVRDYGDLVALTKADATLLHVGLGGAGMNAASAPVPPGGGGGGDTTRTPETPLGGELPASSEGDSSVPSEGTEGGGPLGAAGGGGTGGGDGGGGGGNLPFTGFYVALVGAIGSGMSAAGVALRRKLNRGQSPD